MKFRPYDSSIDRKAVQRIWVETGWIDRDEKSDAKYLDDFLASSNTLLAELNGSAESIVTTGAGSIKHLNSDISMDIVASVTTSFVGRKQGLASRLTAQLIATGAQAGMETAALGMFEQGYYTRLGFGTGPYEHTISFDPSSLIINNRARVPERLTVKNYKDCHQALMNRWRGHGAVQVLPAKHFKAEMGWSEDSIGLGYRDQNGVLTHFIWAQSKGEHGPFKITAIAYQNAEQFLELMAMLKGLGDQIYSVEMIEPAQVQMQDLLKTPFKEQDRSANGEHEAINTAEAFWQLRINDIEACLKKTHLPNRPTLSFNATIHDSIKEFLPGDHPWQGAGGEFTIHLGENSEAIQGHSKNLPKLECSISAFSRLWMGSAQANSLAIGGTLQADKALLDQLEQALSLPLPKVGWEF